MLDGFDAAAHDEEAKRRWGERAAYRESGQRTKRYAKEDWQRMRAEAERIVADYARAFTRGADPSDPTPRAIAERARLHIDKWFYPCSHRMHAALGKMYVEDDRFAAYYDRHAVGLAEFVCDAIQANANAVRSQD